MKRLIVGVDLGVTVGLAVLSFTGSLVSIQNRRSWRFSDLIKTITDLGEPSVIASDVTPASDLLGRLSHKFNAVLFIPLISMGAQEKKKAKTFAKIHSLKLSNSHEVDALAAALKAFQHYEKKFSQVEARVKKQDLKIQVDDVKDLVIRGYSLKRAVQILKFPKKFKASQVVKRRVQKEEQMKSLIEELETRLAHERTRVKRLRATNNELRTKIKSLRSEMADFEKQIAGIKNELSVKIRRGREYQLLRDELNQTRARLSEHSMELEQYKIQVDETRRLRNLESQSRLVLLKPIERFTENRVRKAFHLFKIKAGNAVFLFDPSGGGATTAEMLTKRGISVVVTSGMMAHHAQGVFIKNRIPVVSSKNLDIEWIGGLPYVQSESLMKATKKVEESGENILSYADIRTIVEDHKKLKGMFNRFKID